MDVAMPADRNATHKETEKKIKQFTYRYNKCRT